MGFRQIASWGFSFFISTTAFALGDCPFLVATSLTDTGGATIASGKQGELHFIEDFRNVQTHEPEWVWAEHRTGLPAAARQGMVWADLLTDIDVHNGVWFLTQSVGADVHLVSPNGLPFRVVNAAGASPRAARFYRKDLVYSLDPHAAHAPDPADLRANRAVLPGQIWAVFDDAVYRTSIALKSVDDELLPRLARARWPIRFREGSLGALGEVALDEMDGLIELAAGSKSIYWLPTSDPKLVLQVSPPQKVFSPSTRGGIDFLQVTSPTVLVVGNELGEVQIWNYETRTLVEQPRFNTAVWLRAVTAFSNGGNLEILALPVDGKSVYRWNEAFAMPWFKKIPDSELPDTTSGFTSIAASSYIVPPLPGYGPVVPPAWIRYSVPHGSTLVQANRVVLAGQDGTLYGTAPAMAIDLSQPDVWLPFPVPR
jgi:hypothetical protein